MIGIKKSYLLFISLVIIIIVNTSCSSSFHFKPYKKSQKTLKIIKLTNTIDLIHSYYFYETKKSELINHCIDSISNNIDNLSLQNQIKSLSLNYKGFERLIIIIEFTKNNTRFSYEEIVSVALHGLMDKLDNYSIYIDSSSIYIDSILKQDDIFYEVINDRILYVKIPHFRKSTPNDLSNIIKNSTNKSEGIILDLRDNLGGNFVEAIDTVNLFVEDGILLYVMKKDKKNTYTYKATKETTISVLPLVILINKNSASSSEIVSGALQGLKRATIIGEKSFGKSTIQTLVPLSNDTKEAIKLTTAKFIIPNQHSIENKITPNIFVESSEVDSDIDRQLKSAIDFLSQKI